MRTHVTHAGSAWNSTHGHVLCDKPTCICGWEDAACKTDHNAASNARDADDPKINKSILDRKSHDHGDFFLQLAHRTVSSPFFNDHKTSPVLM